MKNEPKRFFTSDTHFGHKNILNYCYRPFADMEQMQRGLIKHWNETVGPDDEIYVLGDFSFNPKWSRIITPQLNGKKHLIYGNHDAPFPNKEKHIRKYFEDGWITVRRTAELTLKDGTIVNLNHFPYTLHDDGRFPEYRTPDNGRPLIHGHTHGLYFKKNNGIDVGYDVFLRILTEDEVIAAIKDPRDFIEAGGHNKNRPRDYKE